MAWRYFVVAGTAGVPQAQSLALSMWWESTSGISLLAAVPLRALVREVLWLT